MLHHGRSSNKDEFNGFLFRVFEAMAGKLMWLMLACFIARIRDVSMEIITFTRARGKKMVGLGAIGTWRSVTSFMEKRCHGQAGGENNSWMNAPHEREVGDLPFASGDPRHGLEDDLCYVIVLAENQA
jgi:hypothetical protein